VTDATQSHRPLPGISALPYQDDRWTERREMMGAKTLPDSRCALAPSWSGEKPPGVLTASLTATGLGAGGNHGPRWKVDAQKALNLQRFGR